MHPAKIHGFLWAEPSLQPLAQKAQEISALSDLCKEVLPAELVRYTRAANLKRGTLVLLAANPAVAAKLKLLVETLRSFLLMQGKKVNSVSVRVHPSALLPATNAAHHKEARLSARALAELAQLHAQMAESPARRALQALLARHNVLQCSTSRPDANQVRASRRDSGAGN